jgi:uncharacterized protein YceK
MKKIASSIAVCLSLLAVAGCSSVASHVNNIHAGPYAGVRQNFHDIDHPEEARFSSHKWINYLDIPFSATSDAITLPIDLVLRKGNENPKTVAQSGQ